MENVLLTLITSAIAGSFVISGITEVVKQNTRLQGVWVIVFSVVLGTSLFGVIAFVYELPLAESLLLGFVTGLAGVGAFNGFQQIKGGASK